mgnify:CR=1 FL=1
MKKSIIVSIIIIGVIVAIIAIALFLNQKPKQDITENDFDNFYTPQKEQMCCENCLSYGEYGDSKDCLEIIKEHGGIMHGYLIMEEHPHTFSQCKQLMTK